jgi:hypothetical protein
MSQPRWQSRRVTRHAEVRHRRELHDSLSGKAETRKAVIDDGTRLTDGQKHAIDRVVLEERKAGQILTA